MSGFHDGHEAREAIRELIQTKRLLMMCLPVLIEYSRQSVEVGAERHRMTPEALLHHEPIREPLGVVVRLVREVLGVVMAIDPSAEATIWQGHEGWVRDLFEKGLPS